MGLASERGYYETWREVRTWKVAERQICQIRTAEFEADTILGKAELRFAISVPVWS